MPKVTYEYVDGVCGHEVELTYVGAELVHGYEDDPICDACIEEEMLAYLGDRADRTQNA